MADKNLVVKKGIEVSETGSFGGNLSTLGNLTVSGTVSGVTKAMVGLSHVDNTTDANKPISTATQTALNTKVSKVTSTDNALVRFDGTTGDVQNSLVTVEDGGAIFTKRWVISDVPAGKYCPIMSFGAGSWGYVTSGTLTVTNAYPHRATSKVYAVNLMGEGHGSVHLTLLSQTEYYTPCPFDVYGGFNSLGAGSDIIYFLNRNDSVSTVTFTYRADTGAPTTYYTDPAATFSTITGLTSFFTQNTSPNTLSELLKATFGSAVMRLRSANIMDMESGRVLIGTTTDNGVDKLQVAGSISSTPIGHGGYDANTLSTVNKTYVCSVNATNMPLTGDFWYLEVMVHDANIWAVQRATSLGVVSENTNKMFIRSMVNGSWTPWVEK